MILHLIDLGHWISEDLSDYIDIYIVISNSYINKAI